MSYEKLKNEAYSNFAGINTKVSTYITGPNEALDLKNIDFSRVGAWSQRQGSTAYFGTSISPYNGTTAYASAGITYLPRILGLFEYEKLSGFSQILIYTKSRIYLGTGTSMTLGYSLATDYGTTTSLQPPGRPNYYNPYSFVVMNDILYASSGDYNVFSNTKYNGITFYAYGLPPVPGLQYAQDYYDPLGDGFGFGVTGAAGTSGTGFSGTISVAIGWMDITGYRGLPSTGLTLTLNGTSFSNFSVYFSASYLPDPKIFGATALTIYVQPPNAGTFYNIGDFGFTLVGGGGTLLITPSTYFSATGSSFTIPQSNPVTQNIFQFPVARYPLIFNNSNFLTVPFSQRYLEIYNSQMFLAGFQGFTEIINDNSLTDPSVQINYASRIYWSDTGDPQFIDPAYFAEVRTNDGDRITGLKTYNNALLIFKQRSFHRLFGTSPTDISIQQISDQYGCLSNKAVAVYNQQCLFLDRKGVARFDGANLAIVSTKVEPVFQRMNIPAAIENALAIHLKINNQVWFCIPVDGATMNNLAVIYDYFADSWTTYSGFVPSALTIAKGRTGEYNALYGSYSGAVFNFGSTLLSDNGTGITCQIQTLFYREMGQSVEKQFRRLFLNTDIMSVTSTILAEMIADYGTSVSIGRTMQVGAFQNRIDFGIPAKALQFRFTYCNATLPIRINGITVESRFQRAV